MITIDGKSYIEIYDVTNNTIGILTEDGVVHPWILSLIP